MGAIGVMSVMDLMVMGVREDRDYIDIDFLIGATVSLVKRL